MIAVFYGKDDFSSHDALAELKAELDTDGMLADNTTKVEGRSARPDELLAQCQTMPFLGSRRLVIVDGLLKRFDSSGRRPRRGKARRKRDGEEETALGPWQAFADGLAHMPESTTLVLLDEEVNARNPLLQAIQSLDGEHPLRVREFTPLKQRDVAGWINQRAKRHGVSLHGQAVRSLAALVGGNLWMLDSELQKLAVYAGDRQVTEEDVRSLVSLAREANVFALLDAVAEGRSRDAAELVQRLIAESEPPQRILVMLAMQYRRLLLTKELAKERLKPAEMSSRLGVQPFVMQRLLQQTPNYTEERLRRAYARLLEADLSVKRGIYDDVTAVQLLVIELCALARESGRGAASRPGGRPDYNTPRRGQSPPRPAAGRAGSGRR